MKGYTLGIYGELKEIVEIAFSADDEPIIPAGVFINPELPEQMVLSENEKLVLEDGTWIIKENHIGTRYWLPGEDHNSEGHVMSILGPLPEGASLVAPPEPSEEEKWAKKVSSELSPMSAEELRSYLYSTQKFRFKNDDITAGESSVPMCYIDDKVMTVDEASQEWLRYLGDDDSKAQTALEKKVEAKEYIRSVVSDFKEEN